MLFQMQHARRAGSRERDLDEREDRPSSRAESGGRAIGNREALPEQSGVPHGRASFHGGAAAQPHPSTSRPLVGARASGGAGTVGGRGASRFREQREPPLVTRPSADFNKSGK